jgi:Ca2+-binding EF-hand superfamily protein
VCPLLPFPHRLPPHGTTQQVKDDRDWKLCLDSVEENFKRLGGGPTDRAGHLEAFIVELDPTKFAISTRPKKHDMIRTVLTPKRVVISGEGGGGGAEADHAAARHSAAASTRLVAPLDFESKHKWIDEMMRKVGADGGENDGPASLRGKWDALLKECQVFDPERKRCVTPDMFRKALKKVEPKMTAAQVDWFVKDSDKEESGDVLYDKYCSSKRAGLNVSERQNMQDKALMGIEAKINEALQTKFRSLQQAFKRFDVDKDGALSASEFKAGLEQRLHIKLAPKLLDAGADTHPPPSLTHTSTLLSTTCLAHIAIFCTLHAMRTLQMREQREVVQMNLHPLSSAGKMSKFIIKRNILCFSLCISLPV